jgi:hypothetical protein
VTPETVDNVSPARVVLAGIDYKIFVFVICRYMEVTINAWSVGRKTLKKETSLKT